MSQLARLSLLFLGVYTWHEVTSAMNLFLFVPSTILMTSLKDTQHQKKTKKQKKKHPFFFQIEKGQTSTYLSFSHTRRKVISLHGCPQQEFSICSKYLNLHLAATSTMHKPVPIRHARDKRIAINKDITLT